MEAVRVARGVNGGQRGRCALLTVCALGLVVVMGLEDGGTDGAAVVGGVDVEVGNAGKGMDKRGDGGHAGDAETEFADGGVAELVGDGDDDGVGRAEYAEGGHGVNEEGDRIWEDGGGVRGGSSGGAGCGGGETG